MEPEAKNIYAEKCPADAIREYIEKIIKEGKEIPEEIIISPKNVEYLMNSKLVDFIGAGETGDELQFYWEKTDKLPALELKLTRREDGKFILTYIKEEASEEKGEFLWEKGKGEGTAIVFKKSDALEDIVDMDR